MEHSSVITEFASSLSTSRMFVFVGTKMKVKNVFLLQQKNIYEN